MRVQDVAGAQRLWTRLGDFSPGWPVNPAEGFPDAAVEYARIGREYVRMALEVSTTNARQRRRRMKRAHIKAGWGEAGLYEDREVDVRRYQERHRGE